MATGDILAVRIVKDTPTAGISCNGWVAEIDIDNLAAGGTYNFGLGANNDPITAKVVFNLTSPGYDTSGSTTTVSRTVYGTTWLRKPYPNETAKDESTSGTTLTIRVVLSDFIYSGDTAITATIAANLYTNGTASNATTAMSVTNNSTAAYPKAIGRWGWPGWERVTGDFLLEAVVFHKFAKDGKPLAAVKFTCSDAHGNSTTQTATAMTVSSRSGDANTVLVYAVTIPVSSLTQGDVLTCNFVAYPWVGDSTALLSSDLVANGGDGFAQPDERLGPLKNVNDKSATYGAVFAVVDPTNGQDSSATTWVYTSQASAESNYAGDNTKSYKYLGRAAAAIKSYNNSNYSRNNPGAGTVLMAGLGSYPGYAAADSGAMDAWLTVTRLSTVARASAGFNAGTIASSGVRRIKMEDITLSGSSTALMYSGASTDAFWVHNCTVNFSGTITFYVWRLGHVTQSTLTAVANGFKWYSTNKMPFALLRGNTGPSTAIESDPYNVIGNKQIIPNQVVMTGNAQGQAVPDNGIVAFNTTLNLNAAVTAIVVGDTTTTSVTDIVSGFAIVQNVLENRSSTSPLIQAVATNRQVNPSNNVLLWHNSVAGARTNCGYNGYGSAAVQHQNWSIVGNNLNALCHHQDDGVTFDTANGNRSGGFRLEYMAGGRGNNVTDNTVPVTFVGLWSVPGTSGARGFVDDKSSTGTAAGNGDYHITSSSTAKNLIASAQAVLPYDLEGTTRRNDGTGAAGAYEFPMGQPTILRTTTIPHLGGSLRQTRF